MKPDQVTEAQSLLSRRYDLQYLIARVNAGGVEVTINSQYQDDDMRAAVAPAAVAELQRRLKEVETALVALGVEIYL